MGPLSNTIINELQQTVVQLAAPGKGLLAADESNPTIAKRFDALGIQSTEDTRKAYRELLCTTQGIEKFISGVILFEETLKQKTSEGITFPELLKQKGILAGIKVDKGLIPIPFTQEENMTQGLDGLQERLLDYKKQGASFAKWRAVYSISNKTPSLLSLHTNAEGLARYAAICQSVGIVPIVEPEVLIDGNHDLITCAHISEAVLHEVFQALYVNKVIAEYIILKPSMVITGKQHSSTASPEEVAEATIRVLKRTVPAAVPSINFLSGGQTPLQATQNLNQMHHLKGSLPWNVSFSYARALQEPCMKIWLGNSQNIINAQNAFYQRARLNSLASKGAYLPNMEEEPVSC